MVIQSYPVTSTILLTQTQTAHEAGVGKLYQQCTHSKSGQPHAGPQKVADNKLYVYMETHNVTDLQQLICKSELRPDLHPYHRMTLLHVGKQSCCLTLIQLELHRLKYLKSVTHAGNIIDTCNSMVKQFQSIVTNTQSTNLHVHACLLISKCGCGTQQIYDNISKLSFSVRMYFVRKV